MPESVKILVVDDLPEKHMVFQAILEEDAANNDGGYELIFARSGPEALRRVLQNDFAVILLDVNMPDMDGLETAAMIRARKRSAHTPIIFITAYADEVHAIRGYEHGAVDYILSPVQPAVLRTKVRVFVDLFRKSLEIQRQAEALRELQAREHRRQMSETNERLRLALEAGQMATWEWEQPSAAPFDRQSQLSTRLLNWSPQLETIFGFEQGEFQGTTAELAARLHPEDRDMVLQTLTKAMETGNEFRLEHRIIRPLSDEPAWLEVRGKVFHGAEATSPEPNQPARITGVTLDISERKLAEQIVADSERRYRHLVQALPAAVYTCDRHGQILLYNQAAIDLWGRTPGPDDRWCGSMRLYELDGTLVPPDQCLMAMAVREGRAMRGRELVIERPDGTRRTVVPYPEPIVDNAGNVTGAINMIVDITERKAAEATRALLAAIVESSDDAIISKALDGCINSWNAGAHRIFGYTSDEAIGKPITIIVPADLHGQEREILTQLARGERVEQLETVRKRKDGNLVDVSLTISPLRDESGRVIGASHVARDITARKAAEAELSRHREHLEQLVHERTEELRKSLERLRLADRLASIGTLAAGLGHDMGNLLLPIRMRLEALERMELPEQAREDVRAISQAAEYLKRLSQGLRLFALDPDEASGRFTEQHQNTSVSQWWLDVEPFLRNALPRGVSLDTNWSEDVPAIAMPSHRLTQVVYNLVQNAGDALRERGSGSVRISAALGVLPPPGTIRHHNGKSRQDDRRAQPMVVLSIADDGPGMSEETRRRCWEPFFTTKTRGISTGLGMALVRGAVLKSGGSVEIDSTPGKGTTIRLILPAAVAGREDSGALNISPAVAVVSLKDPRLRAYVSSVLRSMHLQVAGDLSIDWTPDSPIGLLVLDEPNGRINDVRDFLQRGPRRRAVVLGAKPASPLHDSSLVPQVVCLDSKPLPIHLREAITEIVGRPAEATGSKPAHDALADQPATRMEEAAVPHH